MTVSASLKATERLQRLTSLCMKLTADASYVSVLTVMKQFPKINWTSTERNSIPRYVRTDTHAHTHYMMVFSADLKLCLFAGEMLQM